MPNTLYRIYLWTLYGVFHFLLKLAYDIVAYTYMDPKECAILALLEPFYV